MPKAKDYSSLQREKLVDEYFLNGGNKKAAMKAAGYKVAYDQYGYKLFTTPGVKKLIEDRKKRLRQKFEVSFETILERLAELADGYKRVAKYKKVDSKGQLYWDFTGATEEDLALITTIDTEIKFDGDEDNPVTVHKMKIGTADLKDAHAALGSLAKLIGIDKAKVEISGPNGQPIEIDNKELGRKLAFLLTKGALASEEENS